MNTNYTTKSFYWLLIWYILWIKFIIADSSDDDSDSGDSGDSAVLGGEDDAETNPLVGVFTSAGPMVNGRSTTYIWSVCQSDRDSNLYISGRLRFTGETQSSIGEYFTVIGRQTAAETFSVFMFDFDANGFGSDVTETTATMMENTNTGAVTLGFGDMSPVTLTRVIDAARFERRCIIPTASWEEVERPIVGASGPLPANICPSAELGCEEIDRFEDPTPGGVACWGFWEPDDNAFEGGGVLNTNVQIQWDGLLRITGFTDLSSPPGCDSGSVFQWWSEEEEKFTVNWKCVGIIQGAIYEMDTESDTLEQDIGDQEIGERPCPYFIN